MGLSYEAVAAAVGIARAASGLIMLYEEGLRNCEIDRVPALAKALQTDPGELVKLAMATQMPNAYAALFKD